MRGEYVSVSEPSGCGTSTFLSILALLDTPSSGRYWLNGRATDRLSAGDKAREAAARILVGRHQQLVAVARAITGRPAILLADEPTGNPDSKSGEALMQMFGELHAGGATVCLATHDPRWLTQVQRHIYLFDGRMVDRASSESDS